MPQEVNINDWYLNYIVPNPEHSAADQTFQIPRPVHNQLGDEMK